MENESNSGGQQQKYGHHPSKKEQMDGVDAWILPTGAESIIKQIAAEKILHDMLNHKLGHPEKLESRALHDLVTRYPGTCLRTYEFVWEDGQTRDLSPFAMLCCMKPPLWLVQAVYESNPNAITIKESRRGSLPLHYACAFEAALEVVQFIHSRFPEAVSTPRKDHVYPLHLACGYYGGNPSVINFLLDQFADGASKRCTDLYWFPLHSAAQGGAPVSVMERLHSIYPESTTGLDKYGKTPLHTACRNKGNPENVEFLVRVAPEALQMEDYGHFKPIFLAAMYQTAEIIEMLLRRTRDRVDNLGATLLHWASVRNSCEVVDFLASRFPEMLEARTRDHDRYTPLLGACLNDGPIENIRCLIKHNRHTLTMTDGDGRSPLDAAIHTNASSTIIELLTEETNGDR